MTPRRWIVSPAPSWNGGIFDPQVGATSLPPTHAEDRPPGDASPTHGYDLELQPWEGLEGEEAPGAGGGIGRGGRACACDLDDCPHNLEMPTGQQIAFDESLLHQMMHGLNPRLITPRKERQRRDLAGKRSTARTDLSRGRYIRARHSGRLTRDIALDATIRTAAVNQQYRDRKDLSVVVDLADLHAKVRQRKVGNLLLFVVDCSASMGIQRRILATQGAILSLLVDAYQRRDRVGLITFREQSATVILRPTASIELAKEAFQSLSIGGTTPLSKGLMTAYEVIERERRKERRLLPVLLLISDGNANVSISDADPFKEATSVAEMIRAEKIRSIVFGTGGEGWRMSDGSLSTPARELATAMRGEFYPVEEVTAEGILEILRAQSVLDD